MAALNLLDASLDAGVADVCTLQFTLARVEANRRRMSSQQHARFLGVLAHVAIAHETLAKHLRPGHVADALKHMRRSRTPTWLQEMVSVVEHVALLCRYAPHLATP